MPCPTQVDTFAAVAAEWDQLLAWCPRPSVFLTRRWQRAWWETFGHQGSLCLLPVRLGDTVVGLAPLMRREGMVTFLGDTDLFDYHDFLYARGSEEAFFPALVECLEQVPWTVLDLRSLPGDSPTLRHLPELLRRRGYQVAQEQEDVAPGVSLPGTWEGYLAGLSKKDRHELRRKLRRLETAGPMRYACVSLQAVADGDVSDFLALMRASDAEKSRFLTAEREAFFRHLLDEMAWAGCLRLCFLELGGQRVASVVCFDSSGTRYLYNSGYNPAYAHLSVGLLLKALCLREAIQQGLSYFDFLRGAESYKYDLGARDVDLYRLVARRA